MRGGKRPLFPSHEMGAVESLCASCRFPFPTQTDHGLFPSQLYVGRRHLYCSIKNHTQGFYSTGGQELLAALSADVFDIGVGPRITPSHHCSSLISNRWARILRIPRSNVQTYNG